VTGPVRVWSAALVGVALAASATPVGAAASTLPTGLAPAATVVQADAVVGRRKLGESVRGRPIMAYRLGERDEKTVVLLSTMHGDEPRTRKILVSLREGRAIRGVDLWVVPTYNPDGLARGTRKNARGVDLNRNFPYRWADLDGPYESGPRPRSEPETRAVVRFLKDVEPHRILSFHQPLHGVDQATKNRRYARKVARTLRLPRKTFSCGGVCHGTMTQWYNHRFDGAALTVEYGRDPSRRMMRKIAPRRVLRVFSARRVRLDRLR
jgi:predicted deacylase